MFLHIFNTVTIPQTTVHQFTIHPWSTLFSDEWMDLSGMLVPLPGNNNSGKKTNSLSLSHLSASSFGLCLDLCRAPSFAESSLLLPACPHRSRCLSTADSGPGTVASRRTASGPGTLYLFGEACHLGYRGFYYTGQQKTHNSKCLFLRSIAGEPAATVVWILRTYLVTGWVKWPHINLND